jgi:pyruvate formate lyase activating enzyme
MICRICPHHCSLEKEGQHGFCKGRVLKDGKIADENYGRITSIALDPIEKKPLKRFFPGSKIISIGSYGCNLCCPFCQNFEISQADDSTPYEYVSPEELVNICLKYIPKGNIGIAFTYNEPTISFEYMMDVSKLAKKKGLKTVMVTNGMICEEPLRELLPFMDAFNIDLKAYTERFYKMCGGDLETVKNSIRIANEKSHVEVTTLVIPDENDSDEEMESIASFLASVNPEIPLHISRFFPRYKMSDKDSTPVERVLHLAEIAKKHLKYVYPGNI